MTHIQHLAKEHNEIRAVLHSFYMAMQKKDVEQTYVELSPNLRQLVIMPQHIERYESIFKFGRSLGWLNIFSLVEIQSGLLEGVVVLCLLSGDVKRLKNRKDHKDEDWVYSAFKMRFIFLDEYWFIDEMEQYNEFWSNEFKEFANQYADDE